MAITKPKVRAAWGDTAVPTTDIYDPDLDLAGFVSAGWKISAIPPSRQYFNWAMNYAANGIRYFSRRGVVDWDALETYVAGDIVRGTDNVLRVSLQGANLNQNPISVPAFWGPLPGYVTSLDGYVTQVSLTEQLLNYVTQAQLANTIANYYTQSQVNALLVPYDTVAARNAALAAYHTVAAFNSSISYYSTTAQMNTALAAYATLAAMALKANTLSPTLTGAPAAPTAAAGTNTTQIASTAFVTAAIASIPIVKKGLTGTLGQGGNAIAFSPYFPTACDSVVVTPVGNSATYSVVSVSRTGFTINTGASVPYYWIAMGR